MKQRRTMLNWGRRQWLKGVSLGAGSLMLPFANKLVSEAKGAVCGPKRVFFLVEGNGFHKPAPVAEGGRIVELSPSMTALQPYLDEMTMVGNLQQLDGAGHYRGYIGMTCVPNIGSKSDGAPGAASIDQEIARDLGAGYPWSSLSFSANKSLSVDSSILATGIGAPLPSTGHPDAAFAATFGLALDDPETLKKNVRRRVIMDSMREDLAKMQAALAGPEREKLEKQVATIDLFAGRMDYMANNAGVLQECRSGVAPFQGSGFTPDSVEGRSVGFFELAAQALICCLTPVVTVLASCGRSFDMMYSELGYTTGKHGLGHGAVDSVMGDQSAIHNFYAALLAQLCDTLRAVPEGDGTMLDNTAIVWINENGTQHHSRPSDPYFAVVLGGKNLGLKRGGSFLDYEMNRSWPDFLNTIAHAVDTPRDDFGKMGSNRVEGPLETMFA